MGSKRKEREEEAGVQSHGSTLFISNVPYTATSTDLQTLFSDIAPVRTAFVVSDKETKKPKGVGYVSFAMKEDAETAFNVLAKGETILDGRVLRGEWAGRGHKEKPNAIKEEESEGPSPKKARQVVHKPITEEDKNAIRTIVISGLPSDLDSKPLWKKVRKHEGAESIVYPIENAPQQAHAVFTTPSQAMKAAEKLHAHVFKGCMLSVILKKRMDNLVKPSKMALKSQASVKAPNKNSRLIVRNLPWNITEHNLRTIFLPYGPIHTITLPTADPDTPADPESSKKPSRIKARGFAFVWFLCRKDAERALEGANGTLVTGGQDGGIVKPKGKEKVDEKDARTIAVDWALSKERWEAEKTKAEEVIGEEQGEDVKEGDSSSDGDGDASEQEEGSSSASEGVGVHSPGGMDGSDDESDGSSHDEEEEEEEEEEEVKKPTLPTPADGTTLFIRNVPFEATEDELRTLFKAYGPLRYARITMDNSTTPPRPRGTAFVCFWKKEDAENVLEAAEKVKETTKGTSTLAPPKKNPFTMHMPSLLTPDPSSSVARSLVLGGRTLDVVRAVQRDEAGKLLSEGVQKRRKQDKRNLYLLREGVITPSSPIAHTLTPADLSARVDSFNSRRNMLNSNPSLYVSKTRLSVRQLPRWVTEGVLKKLAKHAISAFKKEVREETREGLKPEEVAVDEFEKDKEGGQEEDDSGKKAKKRKPKDGPVVQSKIVRDSAKVDPLVSALGGRSKGRSKGYAFLELALHADALRVLRWCNNNPDAEKVMRDFWKAELERNVELSSKQQKKEKAKLSELEEERLKQVRSKLKELEEEVIKPFKPSNRRLIVEFSIENIQVVKRRTEKISGGEKVRKQPLKRKSMLDGSFSRDEKDGEKSPHRRKRMKNERDQPPRPPKRKANEEGDETQAPDAKSNSKKPNRKFDQARRAHKQSEAVDEEKRKLGKSLGSMIGRKRKERREKRNKKG